METESNPVISHNHPFNSLIIKTADNFAVPAGGALAVDRSKFSN